MICEQARIEAMDGRPNDHVRTCAECAAFLEDWKRISGLLKSEAPAPRELVERLASLPARPNRVLRFTVASSLAAAAGLLIALPIFLRNDPAPVPPTSPDTAQFDAELESIKREIDRIDLNAQVSKIESR